MILDGKKSAESFYEKLKIRTANLTNQPCLAAVQVGDNPASNTYLRIKEKKLLELGMSFRLVKFDSNTTQDEVKSKIIELNSDSNINGIIVQLPLPENFNERELLDSVSISKDIDCLTTLNMGRFVTGQSELMPATPLGVLRLLEFYNIDLEGKNICIIGRSNLVGKPLALALVQKNATVTICHSKTNNLAAITIQSSIVISAVGKPKFLTKEYFAPNQTVIDIGTSLNPETNKLSGDVDFENVQDLNLSITPVPGGVGPMTVYGLIENLVRLSEEPILSKNI
jgi:methylenetetrahydrofolate dehydrogenase (NADP+)/methenyltetrahydrofolate cyclohydrolase